MGWFTLTSPVPWEGYYQSVTIHTPGCAPFIKKFDDSDATRTVALTQLFPDAITCNSVIRAQLKFELRSTIIDIPAAVVFNFLSQHHAIKKEEQYFFVFACDPEIWTKNHTGRIEEQVERVEKGLLCVGSPGKAYERVATLTLASHYFAITVSPDEQEQNIVLDDKRDGKPIFNFDLDEHGLNRKSVHYKRERPADREIETRSKAKGGSGSKPPRPGNASESGRGRPDSARGSDKKATPRPRLPLSARNASVSKGESSKTEEPIAGSASRNQRAEDSSYSDWTEVRAKTTMEQKKQDMKTLVRNAVARIPVAKIDTGLPRDRSPTTASTRFASSRQTSPGTRTSPRPMGTLPSSKRGPGALTASKTGTSPRTLMSSTSPKTGMSPRALPVTAVSVIPRTGVTGIPPTPGTSRTSHRRASPIGRPPVLPSGNAVASSRNEVPRLERFIHPKKLGFGSKVLSSSKCASEPRSPESAPVDPISTSAMHIGPSKVLKTAKYNNGTRYSAGNRIDRDRIQPNFLNTMPNDLPSDLPRPRTTNVRSSSSNGRMYTTESPPIESNRPSSSANDAVANIVAPANMKYEINVRVSNDRDFNNSSANAAPSSNMGSHSGNLPSDNNFDRTPLSGIGSAREPFGFGGNSVHCRRPPLSLTSASGSDLQEPRAAVQTEAAFFADVDKMYGRQSGSPVRSPPKSPKVSPKISPNSPKRINSLSRTIESFNKRVSESLQEQQRWRQEQTRSKESGTVMVRTVKFLTRDDSHSESVTSRRARRNQTSSEPSDSGTPNSYRKETPVEAIVSYETRRFEVKANKQRQRSMDTKKDPSPSHRSRSPKAGHNAVGIYRGVNRGIDKGIDRGVEPARPGSDDADVGVARNPSLRVNQNPYLGRGNDPYSGGTSDIGAGSNSPKEALRGTSHHAQQTIPVLASQHVQHVHSVTSSQHVQQLQSSIDHLRQKLSIAEQSNVEYLHRVKFSTPLALKKIFDSYMNSVQKVEKRHLFHAWKRDVWEEKRGKQNQQKLDSQNQSFQSLRDNLQRQKAWSNRKMQMWSRWSERKYRIVDYNAILIANGRNCNTSESSSPKISPKMRNDTDSSSPKIHSLTDLVRHALLSSEENSGSFLKRHSLPSSNSGGYGRSSSVELMYDSPWDTLQVESESNVSHESMQVIQVPPLNLSGVGLKTNAAIRTRARRFSENFCVNKNELSAGGKTDAETKPEQPPPPSRLLCLLRKLQRIPLSLADDVANSSYLLISVLGAWNELCVEKKQRADGHRKRFFAAWKHHITKLKLSQNSTRQDEEVMSRKRRYRSNIACMADRMLSKHNARLLTNILGKWHARCIKSAMSYSFVLGGSLHRALGRQIKKSVLQGLRTLVRKRAEKDWQLSVVTNYCAHNEERSLQFMFLLWVQLTKGGKSEDSLATLRNEHTKTKKDLEEKSQLLLLAEDTLNTRIKEHDEVKKLLLALEAEKSEFEKAHQAETKRLKDQLVKASNEFLKMEDRLEVVQKAMLDKEKACHQGDEENAKFRAELLEAKVDAEDALRDKEAESDQLLGKVASLEKQLHEARRLERIRKAEMAQLRKSSTAEIMQLKEEMTTYKTSIHKQINEKDDRVNKNSAVCKKMKQQLDQKTEELQKAEERADHMDKRCKQVQQRNALLEREIKKLRKKDRLSVLNDDGMDDVLRIHSGDAPRVDDRGNGTQINQNTPGSVRCQLTSGSTRWDSPTRYNYVLESVMKRSPPKSNLRTPQSHGRTPKSVGGKSDFKESTTGLKESKSCYGSLMSTPLSPGKKKVSIGDLEEPRKNMIVPTASDEEVFSDIQIQEWQTMTANTNDTYLTAAGHSSFHLSATGSAETMGSTQNSARSDSPPNSANRNQRKLRTRHSVGGFSDVSGIQRGVSQIMDVGISQIMSPTSSNGEDDHHQGEEGHCGRRESDHLREDDADLASVEIGIDMLITSSEVSRVADSAHDSHDRDSATDITTNQVCSARDDSQREANVHHESQGSREQ